MSLKRRRVYWKPRILLLYSSSNVMLKVVVSNELRLLMSSRLVEWYNLHPFNISLMSLPRLAWFITRYSPDAVHLYISTRVDLFQMLIYGVMAQFFRLPTIFHMLNGKVVEQFDQLPLYTGQLVRRILKRADTLFVPSFEMVQVLDGHLGIVVELMSNKIQPDIDNLEREMDEVYQRVIFRNSSPRIRTWRFFFSRLSQMNVDELQHRLGHIVKKRLSSRLLPRTQTQQRGMLVSHAELPFRGLVSPQFLEALPKHYIQTATEQDRRCLMAEVDRIINGQRVLFTEWVQLNNPIPYTCDPETGKEWPLLPFYQVLTKGPGIDIKPVWELGKLTELVRLCWITRALDNLENKSYVVEETRRFLSKNPMGIGPHWVSALEVSIRTVSLLWILTFLGAETNPTDSFIRELIGSLSDHLAFIYKERSIYLDRTNHLLGEAVALLIGGLALPNLPRAGIYREEGLRILSRELPRQLDCHGYDREGSTDYHRQVVEWLIQATLVLRRFLSLQRAVTEPYLAAALISTCALADRYGNLPIYGDTDNSRIFPLAPISGTSVEPFRLYYKALFERREVKKREAENTLFALTLMTMSENNEVEASSMERGLSISARKRETNVMPTSHVSELTVPGGISKLSDPPNKGDGIDLYFKVGEMGLPPHGGHAHADALSLQIYQGGAGRLVDPGTHRYGGKNSHRERLRRSWSHATLSLPFDQADPIGMFKWATRPQLYTSHQVSVAGVDVVMASHDGYVRCWHGMVHRREVIRIDGGTVLVIDRLGGAGQTRITFPYPLPPGVSSLGETILGPYGCEVLYQDGGHLTIFSPHPALQGIRRFGGSDAIHSDYYGHIMPVHRFELTGHVKLPLTVVTLLHFSLVNQPRPIVMTLNWRPLSIEIDFASSQVQEKLVRQVFYRQGNMNGIRVVKVTEHGETRIEQTLLLPAEWDQESGGIEWI